MSGLAQDVATKIASMLEAYASVKTTVEQMGLRFDDFRKHMDERAGELRREVRERISDFETRVGLKTTEIERRFEERFVALERRLLALETDQAKLHGKVTGAVAEAVGLLLKEKGADALTLGEGPSSDGKKR